jgi:hypothetical protein
MKYPVYLYKMIRSIPAYGSKSEQTIGEYVRRIELPIPPFVGLFVCARNVEEEDAIEKIWITPRGAVICELRPRPWVVSDNDGYDVTTADWPKTLAYETEGWTEIKDGDELEVLEP